MMMLRYGGRASMPSPNLRRATRAAARALARWQAAWGPRCLFAPAPGECDVEGDVPAMPLLAFP